MVSLVLYGECVGKHRATQWPSIFGMVSCFLSNGPRIRTYLSSLHPRLSDAPKEIPPCLRVVFQLVAGLQQGFKDVEAAFLHHGVVF